MVHRRGRDRPWPRTSASRSSHCPRWEFSMSLRALAFGPLPKSQVQASQRLSLPSSGGSSMSGFDSGGGGGYDAALTVGGPLREPEAFSPVFPDLFGQTQ